MDIKFNYLFRFLFFSIWQWKFPIHKQKWSKQLLLFLQERQVAPRIKKKAALPLFCQPIAEQRHLLVAEQSSRLPGENRAKNAGPVFQSLIIKQNVLEAAGHQMRRKTSQIKLSLCNYASQALGTVCKTSHFSEWAPASGRKSFSSWSQLIASLFPNKSYAGILFFLRLTPRTHVQHAISRQGILKPVMQQTRTSETAVSCNIHTWKYETGKLAWEPNVSKYEVRPFNPWNTIILEAISPVSHVWEAAFV